MLEWQLGMLLSPYERSVIHETPAIDCDRATGLLNCRVRPDTR